MPPMYVLCALCAHFIEENDSYKSEPGIRLAEFIHLDDGDGEYNHDATPGESDTLVGWRERRPELFATYADGKIGPNSIYGPRV